MFCYNCGYRLSEHDFCTACGADVSLYKKIIHASNMYYNEGLEKAGVRDLTGAVSSLRQSLKLNKNNIKARNLLGLVYFELGEVVTALREWVISKNLRPDKNIADNYIEKLQANSARLDSINQTIKKYNQALMYCNQDSKDLAVIQLKKVLSLNPRFIRAHQLLALLYMDNEQWEYAERELHKCMDIDKNNTQTLRYLREVELMLMPDESVKQPGRRRKEESVRYQSDNELIIQPVNVKEPKGGGLSTVVNLGIGLVIGLAAAYFLLVPAARTNVWQQAQQRITEISNASDAKTIQIQELETRVQNLTGETEALRQEIESFVGAGGTLQLYDSLLAAAATYLETRDALAAAADLEGIVQSVNMEECTEAFQRLYRMLVSTIGPELSATYYAEAFEAYRARDYALAIESFSRAFDYDETNIDALYYLGRACQDSGDRENAITVYERLVELFPGTERARSAQWYRNQLGN
ncbi:MAG: tetratricopeptide repeat protein [Acetatifactor sp.]|nr:tetratricopeptide repeat protein [Acetatifactor sp.]MDE7351502.1 tetratricopeptide repeat protein [Acetatifactor sp.]